MNHQQSLSDFQRDGYVFVPGLLDKEETAALLVAAKEDVGLAGEAYSRKDAAGGESKLALRNELDDASVYSAIVRSQRVAGLMSQLLGDEVYHYHHKMMLKEPRVGGAWEW